MPPRRPAYFADLVEGIRYVGDHAFVRWLLVLFAIIFVLTVAPANLMPLMLVRSFPSGEQGNVINLAIFEMCVQRGHGARRNPRRDARAELGSHQA